MEDFIIIVLLFILGIIILRFVRKYNATEIKEEKKKMKLREEKRKLEEIRYHEEQRRLERERRKIALYNKTSPLVILDNNILAKFNLV